MLVNDPGTILNCNILINWVLTRAACSVIVLGAEELAPSPKLISVSKTALMPVGLTGPPLRVTRFASLSLSPSAWNLKRVCKETTIV